jgi:hypothetical protein
VATAAEPCPYTEPFDWMTCTRLVKPFHTPSLTRGVDRRWWRPEDPVPILNRLTGLLGRVSSSCSIPKASSEASTGGGGGDTPPLSLSTLMMKRLTGR